MSPAPDISFKLTCQESPLTYSPLLNKSEEVIWGEVKSVLGKWDLEEEIGKCKVEMAREKESGTDEGSQGCVVGA